MALNKKDVQNIYPLTPLQEGMYFHAQASPESDAYLEQWSIRVEGELLPELVRAAWNELFDRHEVFRSLFTPGDGKRPLQVILRHRKVELSTVNLSAIRGAEQAERLELEREADRRRRFRLDADPLVRLLLVQLSPNEWEIVWSHHHIILDGWSVGVVQAEFIEIYAAKYAGRDVVLTPAPPSFATFVNSPTQPFDERFWREYLAEYETTPELPRSQEQRPSELARQVTELTPQTTSAIREFCRAEGVTLSAVVQGLWGIILSRYACSGDVVFGYVFSGRPASLPYVERMVGLFIASLPVRVQLRDGESFTELVKRLHSTGAELTARQHTSLIDIQRTCGKGTPLFNHVVALENFPFEEQLLRIESANTGFKTISAASYDRTHYDFDLAVIPGTDTLRFRFSYDRSRFDADFMERMGAQLACVAEELIARPDQDPSRTNILPADQWEALVLAPNRTHADHPTQSTIADLFDQQAAARPDAPALLAPHHSDRWMTYEELRSASDAVACYLRDQLAIPVGSTVATFLEPSAKSIVAVLGVLKAGCAYVPIDPEYPAERVGFILSDSAAKAILTAPELRSLLPEFSGSVLDPDNLPRTAKGRLPGTGTPDDLAYLIYTSGSTGIPKGCQITHRNVVRLVMNDRFDFEIGASDTWIMAHSLCFDFSVWEIFGALLRGGRLVIPEREAVRDVSVFRNLLRVCRVTVLNQTPLAFSSLIALEQDAADHDLSDHLRYVIFGGDRLDPASLRSWTRFYPLPSVALINMYGITETTVHVTFCAVTEADIASTAHRSPIGRPLPETTVYICDPHLNPQPAGAPGEILVGGSGVCNGYRNRPELTEERFVPDRFAGSGLLYRSGDMGCIDISGRLTYLGRNDQQVKIRGHRIEPAEVERALLRVRGVTGAVVLPVQGAAGTELNAWLTGTPDLQSARVLLAENVPEYMIPAAFVHCDAFPSTANGKLDRAALLALRPARAHSDGSGIELPATDGEQTLAKIWSAVLGVEQVGRRERYLTLGGDSIKSIQILARLRGVGLNLELKDLFRYPTIAELAPRLSPLRQSAPLDDNGSPFGLTPIQHRYFAQKPAVPAHFNHAVLLRTGERCSEEHLRLALQAILDNHGSLRLRFEPSGPGAALQQRIERAGQPVQFSTVDLSAEHDAAAAMFRHSLLEQQSMHLGNGPVFRAVLYRLPDGERLLLLAHHLAVDGVTWRILQEDLSLALGHAAQGKAISLPRAGATFRQWSDVLHDPEVHRRIRTELPFWQRQDEACTTGTIAAYEDTYTYADATGEFFEWGHAETLALQRACGTYQTNAGELMLTALGRAMRTWSGACTLQIALEGHGREGLAGCDVSRTAGWFTALYPFRLNVGYQTIGRQIKEIKEDLRRVPSGGIGYGILRYLCAPGEGSRLRAQPWICFNYLGEFALSGENGWSLCADALGASVSGLESRPFALEVSAAIVDGRLRFSLMYVPAQLETGGVRKLRDSIAAELKAVTDHCLGHTSAELTPSDLTYKDLSLEELEGIFDN